MAENKEVNIYQLSDNEGNYVSPLTPEKAIYDESGGRLSDKMKKVVFVGDESESIPSNPNIFVDLADKAVKDDQGRVISETYALKSEVSGGGISDAPSDGKKYVRSNNNWVEETPNPDISEKADVIKKEDGGSGEVVKEILPNVYYEFGEVTSLTITLGTEKPGILNEYLFKFTSGSTPTVLNLPESLKWIGNNSIDPSKTYIVSILSGIAVMGGA